MRRVAAALLHHPVLDREGKVVTSAITNLDLHDIARSAKSYGLSDYFVVHPVAAQRELAQRVKTHWTEGSGKRRIPDRTPALELLRIVDTLDAAVEALGGAVELWTTSARPGGAAPLGHRDAALRLREDGRPVVIVFGTGWGLAPSVYARSDAQLDPLTASSLDGYNHLSVRAAAAILFDRLLGPR